MMPRAIPVKIQSLNEHDALIDMSTREYRSVSEQAAYLIIEGLRRAGYLGAAPTPQAERETPAAAASASAR